MDIWCNNITIDEVRLLFVSCIDLPQGIYGMNGYWILWIELVWFELDGLVFEWIELVFEWIDIICIICIICICK